MSAPRVPDDTKRTVVLGRTGAGKTQFAVDRLLSNANFDEIPWVIIDYKGDALIEEIQKRNPGKIKRIYPDKKPPKEPGLYIMHPVPLRDDELVDAWLWKVWEQNNVGLYIDEGYALPQTRRSAFSAILTQGRSKHIPVIILFQRPVNMNLYTVAQADFFAVFEQNIDVDLKKTSEFIAPAITEDGRKITVFTDLPDYYCLWYDVGQGRTTVLRPARPEAEILERFRIRLGTRSPQRGVI